MLLSDHEGDRGEGVVVPVHQGEPVGAASGFPEEGGLRADRGTIEQPGVGIARRGGLEGDVLVVETRLVRPEPASPAVLPGQPQRKLTERFQLNSRDEPSK